MKTVDLSFQLLSVRPKSILCIRLLNELNILGHTVFWKSQIYVQGAKWFAKKIKWNFIIPVCNFELSTAFHCFNHLKPSGNYIYHMMQH